MKKMKDDGIRQSGDLPELCEYFVHEVLYPEKENEKANDERKNLLSPNAIYTRTQDAEPKEKGVEEVKQLISSEYIVYLQSICGF